MPKNEKELLELISEKITNSPALNGAFETLVVKVSQIQEDVKDIKLDVTKLNDALYAPKKGVFAEIYTLETMSQETDAKLENHLKVDEAFQDNLTDSIKKINESQARSEEAARVASVLKSVAGENLFELNELMALKKKFDKLYWMLLVSGFVVIAKAIWDLVKQH